MNSINSFVSYNAAEGSCLDDSALWCLEGLRRAENVSSEVADATQVISNPISTVCGNDL